MRSRKSITRTKTARTRRQQEARLRGLAAINRVRRGESKSLSQAARVEGTTLESIRRLLPAALISSRRGGRVRVKAGDPYSARVEIITDSGPVVVTAHGSRERELAGRNRATVIRVLRGLEPPSSLKQFRNKKVGGHKLISDFELLTALGQAGVVQHLESLYVAAETSAS